MITRNDIEMRNELDRLIQASNCGIDAKEFLSSDVGRRIISKADEMISLAMEKLSKVDPFNGQEIQRIQNEIKVANMFQVFMHEIVIEAFNANEKLQQLDEFNESEFNEDVYQV